MSDKEAGEAVFIAVLALIVGIIFGRAWEDYAYRQDIKNGYLQWTGKYERDQIKALESRLPKK